MAGPINVPPLYLHLFARLGSLQNLGVSLGPFPVPGVCEPSKGQPHSLRTRVRRGRCRREGSTRKSRQVLPAAVVPLLPGLTCPGFAQMCSGASGDSTDALTTALGEPEGCRGHRRKQPGFRPARPPFMVLNLGEAPPHGQPRPPCPGKPNNSRTRGCSHSLLASLGKSRTQGLSHIESRRAARTLQQRLTARGLGDSREGVHTAARGLSSHH